MATKKPKKLPSRAPTIESASEKASSEGSASQSLTPHTPSPTTTPTTAQATNTPNLYQNAPTSTPIPPAPGSTVNPTPSGVLSTNEDMILMATALTVHQLLSQAATGSQGLVPPMTFSGDPGVEPIQPSVNPSQLSINPSEAATNSPQSSQVPTEIVTARSGPGVATTPPQLASNITNAASKTQYRTRAPMATVSAVPVPLRRNSIDGAPPMNLDLHDISSPQESANNDAPEIIVDLREYVDAIEDDNETHVSSSQKSDDECWALQHPQPPPSSEQLDVDDEDLPTWMTKKGQWNYVASTDGGPSWINLLNVYMRQERRLEFTDMASRFPRTFLPPTLNCFIGCYYHTTRSPVEDKGVLEIRSSTLPRRYPNGPQFQCRNGGVVENDPA